MIGHIPLRHSLQHDTFLLQWEVQGYRTLTSVVSSYDCETTWAASENELARVKRASKTVQFIY